MINVIAANMAQAERWARDRGIDGRDFRYVTRPHGLRGSVVLLVGRWNRNDMFKDENAEAIATRFDIVFAEPLFTGGTHD